MKFGKLLGLVGIVGLFWVLWQIRQVLLLLFAAITFATVINALVRKVQRFVPRGWAVAMTLFSLVSVFVAIATFVGPTLISQLPEYTQFSEGGIARIQNWYLSLRGMVPGDALAQTRLSDLVPQLAQMSPTWIGRLIALFTGSLDFLINSLLVLVMTVMLLSNPAAYRRILLLAFPVFYRDRADTILTDCEAALTGWSIGILFNMAFITIFSGIGLAVIGVPLPFVNAVIAGLLTVIPNVGPLLSLIPPMLMGLGVAPWMGFAVLGLYFAIQQLEGVVLTPLVMKRQVSLLPAVALVAQVICAIFFGPLGLFLGLPIVVVVQVWLSELLVKDILNNWSEPGLNFSAREGGTQTQIITGTHGNGAGEGVLEYIA